jgi:pSer/pThr/pTyr-binding forkhead associated (FHA) protein
VGLATAGKLGRFGQWLASGFGILGEAAAFTAAHKTIQALARDPDTVFTGADDFLSEAGSAALLFGPFRMVHWVGAEASAKMVRAQSKLGKSLFVRKGPAEVDAILERTAAGRIRLPWNHAEIGTPLSQLNWLGRGVSSLINHGGGVAAIYGGAALGRWLHWQPANDQALGGNLFDAVVGYGQLFLGTRFLDGFTQGALFEAMGEARIRLRSRSRSANAGGTGRSNLATTTGSHRVPTILRLVGGEGGPLEVHVPPGLKTIRLGRDSSDRESHVSYPAAEEATVHVKGEGVVENHAQFKESESGVWYLGDLGSAAGTVVNGEPLQAGMPHMLRRGDRLRLGEGPEYLLEPIGRFIEPEHPRNPGITFPLADHPPPEVAAEFPYTVLFPGEAFPADRKAGVAVLKSARDGSELIFEGNQTDWRMPDRADGTVPMLQWCIDERGRFFVSKVGAENPAAPNEIILNGIPIPRWAFVRNNDEISIDAHPYQFMVFSRPRTKRPTSNPPRNGPYLLEAYPPEFLAALEPNEPPMILHSPSIQAHTFRADPQHTSFILGSDPQSDPSKPWQTTVRISGANVEDSHAEIAFGTDGSFHILDRGTKQGTYITRGGQPAQRAGIGKWLSLAEDDLVYLGKPGEAGSAEIDFGKRKVIDSGRRKTMTDGLGPMPAAEFPRHLFRHLQPGQPVATLTMGQETIEWGQDKTNMSFGKSVPDEGMGENSGRFSLTDLLVSELHVSFFITTKGEFYVKDLMSKNGTYVNGGERLAPQTPTKLEGEAKIGLGAANGEMGSTLITFRRRAEPRDGGDEPPLAAPPPAAPSPAVPPPPPMSSSPRMVGPPERTNRVDRLPEPSEISFPGPRPAAPTLESATLSAAAASAPSAPSSSSASSAAGASSYEAGSVDEAFADLNDSEITAVGAEAVPEVPEPAPAAASATAAPAPPPASAADANLPVVPSGTAVTTIRSVDDMAIDSALNALSPDSGLASLVGQLHPYLLEAHPDFSASLAGLNLFPRLDSTTRRGVTVETLDDLHRHLRGVKEQTEHRPEIASSEILSDAILGRFKGKSDRKFPLDLYLSSDGKRLQLSSFTTQTTEPLPDAAIALHLNPRAEGNALVAALRYFASIRVPTQVVLPFSVPSNEPAYMGVFFKTEDTSAIYPTVLAMINKTREAGLLGDQYLPFSHRLLDAQNMEIPGVGVLEYHPDSSRDPLGERKYLIVRAYTDYAKQRKAQTPESPFNSRELLIKALRNLTTEGFDLQQPGFRKPESLPSPYAELLDHSLFPPVDPAVVEAFKKSK